MFKFHTKCLCGNALPKRATGRNSDYVVDGRPVCDNNCYVRFTAGPESDWDCPPERGSPHFATAT